jgi:hypothetical protein
MQTEAAPNPFYTEFGKCEIMKKFKEDNIVYTPSLANAAGGA